MSLLEEYKDTYSIEVDNRCGFRVKIGKRMYIPGYFLSHHAATKALERHLATKKRKAMKRRTTNKED